MLWPVQRSKKYLDVQVVQLVEVIDVVALVEGLEHLIREPIQKRLDGRVGELPVGVSNTCEPGPALTINERLSFRELHELHDAATRFARTKGPHQPTDKRLGLAKSFYGGDTGVGVAPNDLERLEVNH
jgi:hypothetical protein